MPVVFRNRFDPDNVSDALPSVTWTLQDVTSGWPIYTAFTSLHADPVSDQTLHYGAPQTSASFFSQGFFAYDSTTNLWTVIRDSGGTTTTCSGGAADFPGPRHPQWQMAVDTLRNRLWLFSGVCLGNLRGDLWYMALNADPTDNTFTQASISTVPGAGLWSAMIHEPVADVLFLFGSDQGGQTHCNWVYGPTNLNPSPGTLTAAQTAAGCATADDWTEVSVSGGTQPPAVASPGMVYVPSQSEAYVYGGQNASGTFQNQLWRYRVASKTWDRRAEGSTAPPVYNGSGPNIPALTALTTGTWAGSVLYHQTHNTGAPKSWLYRHSTDTWTALTTTSGPTGDTILAEDAAAGKIIAFSKNGTELPQVWHGVLA